ncbi:MAG: hypothetical protein CMC13_15250 [Flavobacteriaceae bacterium]|nr:hypothetical protein [Flavobacteriaceae bacterium]|tara:strand:- start:12797 stop:13300 length:504 start_codon:yes stop_codon:yes gene_type:complete
MKIFNKINISKIVKNHLATLVNDNSKKADFGDWLTFLIIPVIFASLLVWFNILLTDRANNIVITTLSILVGLLFNVIVIIFDIIKRDNSQKLKNKLLTQLLTNISYTIFISLIIIGFTVLTFFNNVYIILVSNWLVFFFLLHFFLTVLMVLKRIYILFLNEMQELEE